MPRLLTLRPLSVAEEATIERLARSRIAPARNVERARIVWLAHHARRVPAAAREVFVSEQTARRWLGRFNESGLDGLRDAARSGRPPTYTSAEVGTVVATSLTRPDDLGLPFGCWTLDRLAAYLNEERGIAVKRSRIGEILQAEGRRWRTEETWFGERPDPAFAEKRGLSSPSTKRRPGAAS